MGSRGDRLWEISMSFKDSHIVMLNLNCFMSFSRPPWLIINFIWILMIEENLNLLNAVSRLSFSHFVNNANNAYIFTTELEKFLVNDKITAWRQTNMCPKQYIRYYKQQKWTLKNFKAKNFQKHRCNRIQSVLWGCPTLSPVIFAVLFITAFNVLSAVISCFLVAVPIVWFVKNFETQFL